jgi:hypothetical protein
MNATAARRQTKRALEQALGLDSATAVTGETR